MSGGGASGGKGGNSIDDSGLLQQMFQNNSTRMMDMYNNLGMGGSTPEQMDIAGSTNSLAQQTQALGGQLQPGIQQSNLAASQAGGALNESAGAAAGLGSILGGGL